MTPVWAKSDTKPHEEIVPARLRPARLPLLWVLVPMIVAYAASEAGWTVPTPLAFPILVVSFGVALIVALRGYRDRRKIAPSYDRAWAVAFMIAVAVAASLWHGYNRPVFPEPIAGAPKEAGVTVVVEDLFSSAHGTISGIGLITGADAPLAGTVGARIQFRLTNSKKFARPDAEFDLGATTHLRGVLENAPDGDGFARYLRQRGVALTLTKARCESVPVPASEFRRACTRARERIADALAQGVGREDASRLAALMLGRTSLLHKAEREDFRNAGATHLFAISGLHITGIAAGLLWAARRIRIPATIAAPAILGLLWLYVQMAGAPVSAMRAWIMAAGLAAAPLLGRDTRPVAGLALAAVVTLAAYPGAVRSPGFLLSYLVVYSLFQIAGPLTEQADKTWRPWKFVAPDALGWWRTRLLACKRPAITAIAATLAASLAGFPLVAALFAQVSLIGLVANLALIPLSGPPVILGFVTSVLGACGAGEWAGPFNALGALFMRATAWIAHLAASIPGAAITLDPPPTWSVGAAALGVFAALTFLPPDPLRSPWRYAALPLTVLLWFAVFS